MTPKIKLVEMRVSVFGKLRSWYPLLAQLKSELQQICTFMLSAV